MITRTVFVLSKNTGFFGSLRGRKSRKNKFMEIFKVPRITRITRAVFIFYENMYPLFGHVLVKFYPSSTKDNDYFPLRKRKKSKKLIWKFERFQG